MIDPQDTEPMQGELFLINWESAHRDDAREIVELSLHPGRYGTSERGFEDGFAWMVHKAHRSRSYEEAMTWLRRGEFRGADGPYAVDGPGHDYLRSKLRGKVIGIHIPQTGREAAA